MNRVIDSINGGRDIFLLNRDFATASPHIDQPDNPELFSIFQFQYSFILSGNDRSRSVDFPSQQRGVIPLHYVNQTRWLCLRIGHDDEPQRSVWLQLEWALFPTEVCPLFLYSKILAEEHSQCSRCTYACGQDVAGNITIVG